MLEDSSKRFFLVFSDVTVSSSASETSVGTTNPQDHMVTKISALEDELATLRSQIAALVTTQQSNGKLLFIK